MRAVAIPQPGGPEALVVEERPVPQPGQAQVLIKTAAAGVNRPDVAQRKGIYPPPPGAPDIPGLELAGEVVAVGPGTSRWKPGDQVTALVAGGGYAEYCVAHEQHALPMPTGFSDVEAAAVPETFFTVWTNVFDRGKLRSGETLLVHGGSSGIGTTAIQLGKAFGARVIATAGSDEKCKACLDLGAAAAINYRTQDFVAETKAATEERGADVILDIVGGEYIERNFEAAAVDGRILQVAIQGGARATVNFSRLMMKRLTHTGSTLRPRSVPEKAAIARALEEKVWPLFATGQIKPVIFRTFPLAEAAAGHALMETSTHIGKIVLTV